MQTGNGNIRQSFGVHDPEAVYEATFQAHWDHLADGAVLTANDGSRIRVLARGEWNHEAGPDFRNARICYHGKIVRGDIELHRKTSDYIRHGHLANPAYDHVILHVVEKDDLAGREGGTALAHIPLCRLSPEMLRRRTADSPCRCRIFPYMYPEQLHEFFTAAGQERLRLKSAVILEFLIRSGSGAAFRRAFFRAAGYKRNQQEFLELLRRTEKYPPEVFASHFEALLWGESSLLPDPADPGLPAENRRYIRTLWDEFWAFRREDESPIAWKRDAVRPLNMPERRIAMTAAFFRKFSLDPLPRLAEKLAADPPEKFLAELRKKLTLSDPFWDFRTSFTAEKRPRKAALLGAERAETVLINVAAPSLLAYAKLNPHLLPELKAAALLELLKGQRDNRTFKNAVRRWLPPNDPRLKIFHRASTVQGCLHIYKQYCAACPGGCSSCVLANSLA